MVYHSIKASLIKNTTKNNKINILFIVNNKSQFDLAVLAASKSKHEFFIFHDGLDPSEINIFYSNISFVMKHQSVFSILSNMDRVIVSVGHLSPVLKESFVNIILAVEKLQIPIIEVPHGLFQWGFNLKDNSKFIDLSSNIYGGGEVPSFSDYQINWFGTSGVGYPRYADNVKAEIVVPEYVAVTTNTNWYLYDSKTERLFFSILFQYVQTHPDQLFVWCPHPAERNPATFCGAVLEKRPENLLLYGIDQDFYIYGIESTEDVICHAKMGISTVSTCLVDYEISKTPVSVFNFFGVEELIDNIEKVSVFNNIEELENGEFKPITTGLLKKFDSIYFDAQIDDAIEKRKIIPMVIA